jgi:hypothetical protein
MVLHDKKYLLLFRGVGGILAPGSGPVYYLTLFLSQHPYLLLACAVAMLYLDLPFSLIFYESLNVFISARPFITFIS